MTSVTRVNPLQTETASGIAALKIHLVHLGQERSCEQVIFTQVTRVAQSKSATEWTESSTTLYWL